MPEYTNSIRQLIEQLSHLPGIGPKTAARLAFYLLKQSPDRLNRLAHVIAHLRDNIITCSECYNYAESDPCEICRNTSRSKQTLCIVSKPQDILVIEKTGEYQGVYHVLGGVIDPLEGITPDQLTIRALAERIKKNTASEVILALNSDMAGETTMLYLTKLFKQFPDLKITRLAQGLPIGSDLEYADEITLSSALKRRQEL